MTEFVLDASALLALLQEEPGADRVASALPAGAISSINLSEAAGKLIDKGMPAEIARDVIESLDLDVRGFDKDLAYEAAALRPATASLGLSLGDRACLALTRRLNGRALTSDSSWARLEVPGIEIELIR